MESAGISRSTVGLVAISFVVGSIITGSGVYFLLQQGISQPISSAPKPALDRFKVSGFSPTVDSIILLTNTGRDRGIWSSWGLDPEFIFNPDRPIVAADLKQQVESGIKFGISGSAEVLLARSNGLPLKIVGSLEGQSILKIYVKSGGSIKTVKDLDGKRIGVTATNNPTGRAATYISNRFAIKPEIIPFGNLTNLVVGLKLGRIDAFINSGGSALRLVDSGELGLLSRMKDVYPQPYVGLVFFATEDVIEHDPDLVRRFIKATSETTKYLGENPEYAADIIAKTTGAPGDLAHRVAAEIDWSPLKRVPGEDLLAGVTNNWVVAREAGAVSASAWEKVKVEDVVDVRFLP